MDYSAKEIARLLFESAIDEESKDTILTKMRNGKISDDELNGLCDFLKTESSKRTELEARYSSSSPQ